jgi:hypothetical protein
VFWRPRGNVGGGNKGIVGFNGWLPARLRRFDHLVFGSPHPVWQIGYPPIRSKRTVEKIYLQYDARILGVPDNQHFLLSGKTWTGKLDLPKTRGVAATIPEPAAGAVRPDFFPRTAEEIDAAVAAISKYFREHDPLQVSHDKSNRLEQLFDVLKVRYHTTPEDYATFPPMAQDKDDGTYGKH